MRFMIEIISIFQITIINKNLFIFFILSRPKDFVVKIENYKLDYLQDNCGKENPIFINEALP